MSIAQLEQLELHDMGVSGLQVGYGSKQLILTVEQYIEATQKYRPVRLAFQQFSYLKTSPWLLEVTTNEPEWISLDVQPAGEIHAAELWLLIHSGPSIKLNFHFRHMTVEL